MTMVYCSDFELHDDRIQVSSSLAHAKIDSAFPTRQMGDHMLTYIGSKFNFPNSSTAALHC